MTGARTSRSRPRRRSLLVLLLTTVAAGWLTGRIYGSPDALPLSYVLAAVFVGGSVLSGGMPKAHRRSGRHPVVAPALTGGALFVSSAVMASVVRLVPLFDHALDSVFRETETRGGFAVLVALAVAGFAEEVFYRGAVFERVRMPIVTSTVLHMLATLPVRNVALTLAAGMLGLVCGLSRRTSGGWFAPAVTHVVWSLLVVAFLS